MASDNLVLRSGLWHARLTIPADARPTLNRREFTASLKTGSKTEAQRLKIPYLQQWQSLIDQARSTSKLDPEDARIQAKALAERAREFYADVAQAHITNGPLSTEKADAVADFLSLGPNHSQEEWERMLRHFEVDGRLDAFEFNRDLQSLVQGNMEKQANTLPLKEADKDEIKQILKDPSHYRAKSPITTTRINAFKVHQEQVKGIVQKTVDTQVARLENLKNWLETNRRDLTHESITAYMDTLSVSEKTKKQFLFAGSSFWKWALRYDENFKKLHRDQQSPFQNHDFPTNRSKRAATSTERKAFAPEDVAKLYDAAKNQKNRETLSDLILLGAYTGARIEELCRLKTSDIVKEEGIQCFSIKDAKTAAGERNIPIHSKLQPVVDRLVKNSEDGYLIKSTSGNKYGNRSDALSKQFGRLKTDAGYNSQFVFHSFRKTVITQLQRSDVPGVLIAAIVGHETGTITFDVYSAGPSPKQKRDAISRLKYPIKQEVYKAAF
ncbi:site-specific integrase [Pseudomonas sp. LMG 31766]|uniref:Site-specific integrase n=1 Tax=Pseudomonas chaetocerotis TaxID=2758695 RepID=A0A931GAT4_9PSED|nr:tyrosine-type recombinase/integrase [Pseudomonas chaetocerotis]MBZ9666733.1 site-specific integrase [Pseudomonas chaetocerotis]